MTGLPPEQSLDGNGHYFRVEGLVKHFALKKRRGFWGPRELVRAVDDINFTVKKGEAIGIVGESGCGKSSVAKTILNIYPPQRGKVLFKGTDLTTLNERQWKPIRKKIQYIFQDPLGALDPRMTILSQVEEPLIIHGDRNRDRRREKALQQLAEVGLNRHLGEKYPHELSGGQRQRAVIARALILEPELLICDEPISALDVSIQAQVVNLLDTLRRDKGITVIFISHDLSMVKHLCDRIAVMYMGKIVELSDTASLYKLPGHPYTRVLISSIPIPDPALEKNETPLAGEPPSVLDPPSGCRFHPRCILAEPLCSTSRPPLQKLSHTREVACHLVEREGIR